MIRLVVLEPGPLALVEDLGRPGLAHLGVPASGALDRGAAKLANRLVGNPDGDAVVEITMGGFRRGSPAARPGPRSRGRGGASPSTGDASSCTPRSVPRAVRCSKIGAAERGIRYLLAVRGGVLEPPALGSRSRDTLSGIGPVPLEAGREFTIGGEPAASVPLLDQEAAFPPPAGPVTLALLPGAACELVHRSGARGDLRRAWRLSEQADRIGARLVGPPLVRRIAGELTSEATVPGSMQVAGDGQPTILLADRPVTGGYPVIAIVAPASLDAVAQLRPGQEVRFRHA